jgi:hypothetical protein
MNVFAGLNFHVVPRPDFNSAKYPLHISLSTADIMMEKSDMDKSDYSAASLPGNSAQRGSLKSCSRT